MIRLDKLYNNPNIRFKSLLINKKIFTIKLMMIWIKLSNNKKNKNVIVFFFSYFKLEEEIENSEVSNATSSKK